MAKMKISDDPEIARQQMARELANNSIVNKALARYIEQILEAVNEDTIQPLRDEIDRLRSALSVPLPEIEGGDIAWESPEEWAIEQRAFHAAGRDDVPADVQQLVAKLWAMYCHASAPSASIEGETP